MEPAASVLATSHAPANPAVEATLIQVAAVLGVVFASATVLVILWLLADEALSRRAARHGSGPRPAGPHHA